ncbi:MAG: hypothetical protein CIT02_02150 [Methanobacterium sp. BAmetb5]|nr:MAG: hypothetical protein CIT02_02150 [Methanobacterium sp. BAmetb5]
MGSSKLGITQSLVYINGPHSGDISGEIDHQNDHSRRYSPGLVTPGIFLGGIESLQEINQSFQMGF